jgi:4-amino-4-deoxy-L-arabinose transferase-like glycosyltransferase
MSINIIGARASSGPAKLLRWNAAKVEFPMVGAIAVATICWALALNGGFQGYDDLHYVEAAENWLRDGASLPTDHWSGRLPYVLLLALSIKLLGLSSSALVVVNSALLVALIFATAWLGRLVLDSRGAMLACGLLASTPLFFRAPQTFYPEALETALFAVGFGLTIVAIRKEIVSRSIILLFFAGLLGGTALVLRATSAVIPIALSFFILIEVRRIRTSVIFILALAVGYCLPLLAEGLFYYAMTGNPIYRYLVDSNDAVVNPEMVGETVLTRDALLNFHLAKLWSTWAPAVVRIHWSINHLVNLFATPSLLLVPYLGVVGIASALFRRGGRSIALTAIFILASQYLLYTFVFALSPTPRYYATSVLLFCILGGAFLARVPRLLRSILIITQLLVAAMVGLTQISPKAIVEALTVDYKEVSPIYISPAIADAAYLAFQRDRELARAVRIGFPPVGGAALIAWDGWPRDTLKRTCEDGSVQWEVIDQSSNPSLLWKALNGILPSLATKLPERVSGYLRRDVENTALARRRC